MFKPLFYAIEKGPFQFTFSPYFHSYFFKIFF